MNTATKIEQAINEFHSSPAYSEQRINMMNMMTSFMAMPQTFPNAKTIRTDEKLCQSIKHSFELMRKQANAFITNYTIAIAKYLTEKHPDVTVEEMHKFASSSSILGKEDILFNKSIDVAITIATIPEFSTEKEKQIKEFAVVHKVLNGCFDHLLEVAKSLLADEAKFSSQVSTSKTIH